MATPRAHIEEIRKTKFSIGADIANPLTEDLHQAVKNLSAELYAKDVHFLMELIQNAEDNEYPEDVNPSLEFVFTSRDITATGAPTTLLIFNNEKGFSRKNIESISSVGRSTKKGLRKHGYIGEKGIGFKSVFLVSRQPHIFSNGYQIRFNEDPCPLCHLGYIVPEWVDENPTISDIQRIYESHHGSHGLPTTTIVLPLKPNKVKSVTEELSNIHPETLLFLSKIKKLSVREDNEDPGLNTVSTVSISKESDFFTRKNINAESYTLHLSAEGNSEESSADCSYYMWKQKFPVLSENIVERRAEVEYWHITLAFPTGERLQRGVNSPGPGVYAYLPTEMVTNFPFIIQADFVLASSRETILMDDKWNQGILRCVPSAFVNAFTSLVKDSVDAPASCLPPIFRFLPLKSTSYPLLNTVRDSIRKTLMEDDIIPSEQCMDQKFFHKPRDVGRLMPAFWSILRKARQQGVSLHNLSSYGRFIMCSAFDTAGYDEVLNFLEVKPVDAKWYVDFIQGSNLVLGVSDGIYVDLLLFIADNWTSKFSVGTNIKSIPLVKHVDFDGNATLCSINKSVGSSREVAICLSRHSNYVTWLIDWNRVFKCVSNHFFVPERTKDAILSSHGKDRVLEWLKSEVNLQILDVYGYASLLLDYLNSNQELVISYAHFLYHSFLKKYLTEDCTKNLCNTMPLLDNSRLVTRNRQGVLVPGKGSKWVELIGSNPWRNHGYVELGEDYLCGRHFAGQYATGNELMHFLVKFVGASDVPYINPPDVAIPSVSGPLNKKNAFLLLSWINNFRSRELQFPDKFWACLKEGSWLRVTMNGSTSYKPPSQSFFPVESWGNIFQDRLLAVDISLIDLSFYGNEILEYEAELKELGVISNYQRACEYIGKSLMSLATSHSLSKINALSILRFIRHLRDQYLSPKEFINTLNGIRWMRTSHGYRSPLESVLFSEEWRNASQISEIPFMDISYYGEEIIGFKAELELLGVIISYRKNFQLIIDNLKAPHCLNTLTSGAFLLMLELLHVAQSEKILNSLKSTKCMKTTKGYKSPAECFFPDRDWACLLKVFNQFPLIDVDFYGYFNIFCFEDELKKIGVAVDFDNGVHLFCDTFKKMATSYSITKEHAISFLKCYRELRQSKESMICRNLSKLKQNIQKVNWLWTRLCDYRSPKECILFSPEWQSISPVTLLPFIDDSYYGMEIYEYKQELESMGVIVKLKDGAKLVVGSVHFPQNPSSVSSENVISLLECIHTHVQQDKLPEAFFGKISQKWLKTHAGYFTPAECCLYDSRCSSYVKQTDGPFIDSGFYGESITSYREELGKIGVKVNTEGVCSHIARHIGSHSDFSTIVRIYNFLKFGDWKPENETAWKIWIPYGSKDGQWVSPEECVLHDKDGLFGLQLNVLDKFYEKELLSFFSCAFEVKPNPSAVDYCKLWKGWEKSRNTLLHDECYAFWGYITRHWSSHVKEAISENLKMLPVESNKKEVKLSNKHDVYIADDLLLKDLFVKCSPQSLFVWLPQASTSQVSRVKLLDIYKKIGVRMISESIQKEEKSLRSSMSYEMVDCSNLLIGRGLARLVLGFLADPSINMEVGKRHEAVDHLLKVDVFETNEPITINYYLTLSSGERVHGRASQMVRWEKEGSKILVQARGKKNMMEYATHFAEAIAQGVLWEREDQVAELSKLIRLGFLVEFEDRAIDFFMKSKNFQLFQEDLEFLSSVDPRPRPRKCNKRRRSSRAQKLQQQHGMSREHFNTNKKVTPKSIP